MEISQDKLNQLSDSELIELTKLIDEQMVIDARKDLFSFGNYMTSDFSSNWFHKQYYKILTDFAYGKIKKLMISVPPQHGKSTGSTELLPAFLFGKNPDDKIAIASYNATKAKKFNRKVQRVIDCEDYHKIFPNVLLNESNIVTVSSSYLRNSEEFEIVNHVGSLKAVGRGGALTGDPVDKMIMDDLYKDYSEGNSPIIREAVWDWYTTVVRTRLHNDSQQLIVFTRWHNDDLIGRISASEKVVELNSDFDLETFNPDYWLKINFEAIKTSLPNQIDPRNIGDALWSERHALKKLLEDKALDPERFECLSQGNPISKKGLLYSKFRTYEELPPNRIKRKSYTDTADTGADYMCSIVYDEYKDDQSKYVVDILYTQEPQEVTEPWTADLHIRNNVNEADVESNNGGRAFCRNIERICKERKHTNTVFQWFHQSDNKESRINSNSAQVCRDIVFPSDWSNRWPDFYNDVIMFKKNFKANKDDGAADVLTGIVENRHVEIVVF